MALAIRRPRGCSLTPAGVRLAVCARELIAQADRLTGTIAPSGTALRLGFVLDGNGAHTSALIAACRAALPGNQVDARRLRPQAVVSSLLSERVRVAFTQGPSVHPQLDIVPLFSEPRVTVVSRADWPRHGGGDLQRRWKTSRRLGNEVSEPPTTVLKVCQALSRRRCPWRSRSWLGRRAP